MFPVVIPVAGYGTRSLPASKSIPKEMLPVFDRPCIQLIVEEVIASGGSQVIFVNSRGKSAIEDHFDINAELELLLQKPGKEKLLQTVQHAARMIDVVSVRQKQMLGLGHAVSMAKNLIHVPQFGVCLGDDLISPDSPGLKQLIDRAKRLSPDCGVVLLTEVPDHDVSKYGICEMVPGEDFKIKRCIEKPKPSETSSRWAIIGRYFLPKDIFSFLTTSGAPVASGEIQLTDALQKLAEQGRLFGVPLQGERFDVGDRVGYLKANLHFALRSGIRKNVEAMLSEMQRK